MRDFPVVCVCCWSVGLGAVKGFRQLYLICLFLPSWGHRESAPRRCSEEMCPEIESREPGVKVDHFNSYICSELLRDEVEFLIWGRVKEMAKYGGNEADSTPIFTSPAILTCLKNETKETSFFFFVIFTQPPPSLAQLAIFCPLSRLIYNCKHSFGIYLLLWAGYWIATGN